MVIIMEYFQRKMNWPRKGMKVFSEKTYFGKTRGKKKTGDKLQELFSLSDWLHAFDFLICFSIFHLFMNKKFEQCMLYFKGLG